MQKPKHHIFVCCSYRAGGEAKGICHQKKALSLIQYLATEISDRSIDDIMVSSTGCLKVCDHGPVMVVYPEGYWYGGVDEEAVEVILDALEEGKPAARFLISE